MTRTLHYTWAQFDDPQGRGGGVSVYLRNLFDQRAGRPGEEIMLLTAGHHYAMFNRRIRWKETANSFSDRGLRSFCILNSPVKAPAHDMFAAIRDWRTNTRIARVFERFLKAHGPFDRIVFHSMEGISSEVFALREKFPNTRFIYMWHNYMPLCPQIELLHQGRTDCTDFRGGLRCVGCLGHTPDRAALIRAQRLGSALEHSGLAGRPPGNFIFGFAMGLRQVGRALRFLMLDLRQGLRTRFAGWRPRRPSSAGFERVDPSSTGAPPAGQPVADLAAMAVDYRLWRDVNRDLLNRFDAHWAVSRLVAETIAAHGIDRAKIRVTPLAMDLHAAPAVMRERQAAKPPRDRVALSFIGYQIPSKGLPFLTEALTDLRPPVLREQADLTIYARLDEPARRRLAPLADVFASVKVVHGYDRRDLGRIAAAIDLNIVPSIWRETFNQVGYEMLCLGTPSLISSSVGLGMFYDHAPDFVFRSGDPEDFAARLSALVGDRARLASFFDTISPLPDMDDHVAGLTDDMPAAKVLQLPDRSRIPHTPSLKRMGA